MKYKVTWDIAAIKDFKYISKEMEQRIKEKITIHLAQDPIGLSKNLTEPFIKERRYRYGDYRILFRADMQNQIIRILRVGHRSNVYNLF